MNLAGIPVGLLVKATAMGFFQVMGVVRPRSPGQALFNHDSFVNLVTGFGLFALKLLVLTQALAYLEVGLIDVSWLPNGFAQFVFAFLVMDFTRYWVHYADHRVGFLWQFHRVHHSAETLDATTGLRMHVVDFLQLACIPVTTFGLLFNTSQLESWVIPAALATADVFDAFQHSNTRWLAANPLSRAWGTVLNNPLFHSWHHTRDGSLCDGNYGNVLVIWDKLFGTEVTRPEPPPLLGLEASQALDDRSILGLQLLRRRPASADAAAKA